MSDSNKEIKDFQVMFPEAKQIKVAGKDILVSPFVLKNRMKVVKLFSSVILEAAKNPGFKNLNDMGAILAIIEVAGTDLIEIYEAVLNVDREWLLNNVQLKDEIEIIKTIIEVNDIPLLLGQIQELVKKVK